MMEQNEQVKVRVPIKRIITERAVESAKDPKTLPDDWHAGLMRDLKRMQP